MPLSVRFGILAAFVRDELYGLMGLGIKSCCYPSQNGDLSLVCAQKWERQVDHPSHGQGLHRETQVLLLEITMTYASKTQLAQGMSSQLTPPFATWLVFHFFKA